jgi:hypothetical protein
MTYRRLFISLCIAGLVLLVGVWWSSLYYITGATISSTGRGPAAGFGFISGSLQIGYSPDGFLSGQSFEIFANPIGQLPSVLRERHGPMGNLFWGKSLVATPQSYFHHINLPLWLIYFAFVAIAYLALRRPMRKQRPLEEQGARDLRDLGGGVRSSHEP